jgi:hemerythrin-like metal-binding protein
MNLFVWTESLATGNAFIDTDHRALVLHVNAVLGAIADQQSGTALQQALHDLLDFTRAHFVREEAEMRHIGFKNMDSHCAEHTKLVAQLDGVRLQLAGGQAVEQMALYHFLTWWVKDHIHQEDTELAAAMLAFQ